MLRRPPGRKNLKWKTFVCVHTALANEWERPQWMGVNRERQIRAFLIIIRPVRQCKWSNPDVLGLVPQNLATRAKQKFPNAKQRNRLSSIFKKKKMEKFKNSHQLYQIQKYSHEHVTLPLGNFSPFFFPPRPLNAVAAALHRWRCWKATAVKRTGGGGWKRRGGVAGSGRWKAGRTIVGHVSLTRDVEEVGRVSVCFVCPHRTSCTHGHHIWLEFCCLCFSLHTWHGYV